MNELLHQAIPVLDVGSSPIFPAVRPGDAYLSSFFSLLLFILAPLPLRIVMQDEMAEDQPAAPALYARRLVALPAGSHAVLPQALEPTWLDFFRWSQFGLGDLHPFISLRPPLLWLFLRFRLDSLDRVQASKIAISSP